MIVWGTDTCEVLITVIWGYKQRTDIVPSLDCVQSLGSKHDIENKLVLPPLKVSDF